MKAPVTAVPQTPAPSQKRQIGAVRNACCQSLTRRWRLAETPACIHGSQTSKKPRGAYSAMKSRFEGSFPYRPHRMGGSYSAWALEFPQGGQVEWIVDGADADLKLQRPAAHRETRQHLVSALADRAGLDQFEQRPCAGALQHRRQWRGLSGGRRSEG